MFKFWFDQEWGNLLFGFSMSVYVLHKIDSVLYFMKLNHHVFHFLLNDFQFKRKSKHGEHITMRLEVIFNLKKVWNNEFTLFEPKKEEEGR